MNKKYLHSLTLMQDNNYLNLELESDNKILSITEYKELRWKELKGFDIDRPHTFISHVLFLNK